MAHRIRLGLVLLLLGLPSGPAFAQWIKHPNPGNDKKLQVNVPVEVLAKYAGAYGPRGHDRRGGSQGSSYK